MAFTEREEEATVNAQCALRRTPLYFFPSACTLAPWIQALFSFPPLLYILEYPLCVTNLFSSRSSDITFMLMAPETKLSATHDALQMSISPIP